MSRQRIVGIALIAIITILIATSCANNASITGFAVSDENSTNETAAINETQAVINETIIINETVAEEAPKEKKEKEERPEKPKENTPPVWKSDVSEFILNGKTAIDLNNYFYDQENDTITYTSTIPEKISVEIQNNLAILTPIANNFTAAIEFTATDGDKTTKKEVALIVPEKSIAIIMGYKPGTNYDTDDNGIESTTGVIDLSIENSIFSWDINESNLCARWETYSADDLESTTVCYGSEKCCAFVGLGPAKESWKENFYAVYGQYGATLNNVISSQIIYVDYGVRQEKPYSEIYYSQWQNLSANYYFATIDFNNVCVDTCSISGFNLSSYKLIFEIDNAVLNLDTLTYTIAEEISQVPVSFSIQDSNGSTSGSYTIYKGNTTVTSGLIEPDYYTIEIVPQENVIDRIVIENVNLTKPVAVDIGIGNVSREILIDDVDVKKRYAVNIGELEFEKATLTATATANSLFKCRQWDYETEVCFGTWEKIKDLVAGEKYDLTLTPDDPGFIEGDSNITLEIAPINITNATVMNITNVTIANATVINATINETVINATALELANEIPNMTINVNGNASIILSDYFSNIDESTVFTYYGQDNISILFEDDVATVIPDREFAGVRYSFITAAKGQSSAVSNLFSITVADITPITNATVNVTPNLMLKKKDFRLGEDIEVDFEYLKKDELVKKGRWKEEYEVYEEKTEKTRQELELLKQGIVKKEKQLKRHVKENETIETSLIDSQGRLKDINIEIGELREGKFKLKLPKPRAFKPGKYTLKLVLSRSFSPTVTYTVEQDFTWGVLAVNVNKSIYLPNQDAFIGIGVLDDKGKIVCNANVTLEITNPNNQKTTLTTANGDIKISPECTYLGVTELPDYYTDYSVDGIGAYVMNLTAATANGVRSILDNFTVQNSVSFDVARKGPTRVYPAVAYRMEFTINANDDYSGPIIEYVPSGFAITPQSDIIVNEVGDTKQIIWIEDFVNGNTYNLAYEFDAPDISPEFYVLGPLEIGGFKETRNWQIANDLYGNVKFFDEFATFGQWTESGSPQNDWVAIRNAAIAGAVGGGTACPLAAAGGSNITITTSIDLSDCTAGTGRANWTQITGTQSDNIDCLKYQTSTDGGATWGSLATAICDDPSTAATAGQGFAEGYEIPDASLVSTFKFRFQCQGFTTGTEFVNVSMFNITCDVAAPDAIKPRINASLDNSKPVLGQVVNITANVSDNQALSKCLFIMNGTADGTKKTEVKTVSSTNDQCSQNWTIDLARNSVINFTVIVNDTKGNINISVNRTDGGAEVIGQIIRVRQKAEVSGGSWNNLTAQACNEEVLSTVQGTFPDPCFYGTVPGTCASGVNHLSCNDGFTETFTSSATTNWGGNNISVYNDLITDCEDVAIVNLCYEWWASEATTQNCDISVDADGGTSYTAVTTTCPGTTADPGVICTDITSLESWTCGSFFDATGTRAHAKSAGQKASGGGTRLFTVDALWFNVTYRTSPAVSDTTPPFFRINSTNLTTARINDVKAISQNATDKSASVSIVQFFHNQSGTWKNISNTSYIDTKSINYTVNLSITLAKGNVIGFGFWANDSNNNVNTTDVYLITVEDTAPTFTLANNNTAAKLNEFVNFSALVSDADTISMIIASWNGTGTWINISNTTIASTSFNYTVNRSIVLSRGSTIGWLFYANDSVVSTFTASTLNTFAVADTTPTFTLSINNTSPKLNEFVNFSALVSDADTISTIIASWNGSSTGAWINISNTTIASTSFNYTINRSIDLARGNTIGWLFYSNDSVVNTFTASSLNTFVVADFTPTFTLANNNTNARVNEIVQLSVLVSDADTLSMIIASWNGSSTGAWINVSNITLSSTANNYSINVSVGLARGNTIGWLFYSNDSVVSTFTASSLNTFAVADTTPTFTLAINNTSPNINEVVQLSSMTNDSDILSMVIASWNGTNGVWQNRSNTTVSSAGINYTVNFSVGLASGNTIGWLFYANDSIVNTFTASSLNTFVVVDTTPPIVNTTLNKSLTNIFQNDVINFSANITDETGLSFCQIIINQSGPANLQIINKSLDGATTGQCYNLTEITLPPGGVINFTIRANDTSNKFRTNDTIITVVASNQAPVIKINNVTGANPQFAVDPASGGASVILISFNVTDAQGVGDINASKAIVNLTLGTPGFSQFRFNISRPDTGSEFGTCFNHTEGSTIIINCTIAMQYYDNASSAWVINISVPDLSGAVGINDTLTFTYNTISGLALPYVALNFSTVFLGQQNVLAYPHLLINNTGNDDYTQINITAAALVGTSITTESIAVTDLGVNTTNSSANKRQAFLANGVITLSDEFTGANSKLAHGHTSAFAPNADKGNMSVFIWVNVPSSLLSAQLYNATWNVTATSSP